MKHKKKLKNNLSKAYKIYKLNQQLKLAINELKNAFIKAFEDSYKLGKSINGME